MGYQIQYEQIGQVTKIKKRPKAIISFILVALILVSAISVKAFALPWVQDVLLPGDPAVTAAAFETMVESLQEGTSLLDAIKAFCLEIISHGKIT